jgi:hypothetical protein
MIDSAGMDFIFCDMVKGERNTPCGKDTKALKIFVSYQLGLEPGAS